MPHKFDIKNIAKLEGPERRELIPAETTLRESGLEESMCVADIGCGTGYFAIPAAGIVGEKGRVWALDISQEMLDELARKDPPGNLVAKLCGETDLPLEGSSVDFVLVAFVLHETAHKRAFLKEIKRIMKPQARVVVIDWRKQEEDKGPPEFERISLDEVKGYLTEAGLVVQRAEFLNKSHYVITTGLPG